MLVQSYKKVALVMAEVMCLLCINLSPSEAREGLSVMEHSNSHKKIVVLGASYAGGWNPGRPVAGYQIINKGIAGQQSFEMLSRFEIDVVAAKPDAVLIWGFINDIFRGDQNKIEEVLARIKESFTAMVELARRAGIVPILATEVTVREKEGWKEGIAAFTGKMLGKESYQAYVNKHVRNVNQWIKEKAASEGILLMDIHAALSDSKGERVKEYSKPDGSHISEEGYRVLTQFLEERLKQNFPASGIVNSSAVPSRY
ncbi:MAG: GDSL-type esterase/lipase family protein [Thermosphaera sp.]